MLPTFPKIIIIAREILDERKMALAIIRTTICRLSSCSHFFQEAGLEDFAEWVCHTSQGKEHRRSCSRSDNRCRNTSKDRVQAQMLSLPNRISPPVPPSARFLA